LPQNSFADLLQSSHDFIERRPVELVIAAIDITQPPITTVGSINDECCRMRDVDGIGAEGVMKAIGFGHSAVLIEQKHAFDGMFGQEFSRLPHAIALFGGYKSQLRSRRLDLRYARLELSHAFHAIRSPGAAHKFENQLALSEQTVESERALAVGRSQRKTWGERADLQSFRAVLHADFER
jgi:hypothetical protein